MNIDKFIEKTQQYKKLRSELKADIQLMVCRAKVLTETLYSVAATDDSIIDISEYEMYEELCCLEDIDETYECILSHFDIILDLKYKLERLEEFLGNKIR